MSRAQVLDVAHRVPLRAGEWTETDGRVAVSRRKLGRLGTAFLRLVRIDPDLRITLDALGSAAWRRMDGRTVAAILADLEQEFPDEGRLDERLGLYLARLVQARLVRFQ